MKYLLDTNVCIQHLRGQAAISNRLASVSENDVLLCSVVVAELLFGAFKSENPTTVRKTQAFAARFVSLPFDDRAAEQAARLRATLSAAGTPIGPYDLQIAAIALACDLVIVTHNVAEFSRVPGLQTIDWQTT